MPLGWHSSVHYCRRLSAFTVNAPADHTRRNKPCTARVWDHLLWVTQKAAGPSTHSPPSRGRDKPWSGMTPLSGAGVGGSGREWAGGTGLDQEWQSQDSTFPGLKTDTSFPTCLSNTPVSPLWSLQYLWSRQPCPRELPAVMDTT